MALKGGSMLFAGNDNVLLERLNSAGPGTVNIAKEKIYELGNYQSVGTVFDTPEITYTLESLDVTTAAEAFLCDVDLATEPIDLAKSRPVNIATQIKPGLKLPDPYDVSKSIATPFLALESASYRFGLRENAAQTFSLRGDSIFYNQGATYTDEVAGTGLAGQTIVTTHPAYSYVDGNGPRRILAVVAGVNRLSYGPDFQLASPPPANGAAIVTVTLTAAVPVTEKIRVIYSSPDIREYPQAVHTPATLKPAAVRGKDIDIYIGGYDPANIPGSIANKWTGVQNVTVDWRVTLEKEEEFGNYNAVAQDFEVPTVSGTIEFMPREDKDFFRKLRTIAGITSQTESIGATTAVPLVLDVVLKDGQNGGVTLKRLHVGDARFSVPGVSPRPNTNVTVSLEWESDSGELLIYRDVTAPRVVTLEPASAAAAATVKIFGVNFVGVTAVEFGAVAATTFTVRSDRQIDAVVPAGTGTVEVTVTNAKGVSTVVQEFTYA